MVFVKTPLVRTVVWIALLSLCSSCSKQVEANNAVGVGPLMADTINIQFAIYYLPTPTKDPQALLRTFLAKEGATLKLVDKIPEVPKQMLVSPYMEENVISEYMPPDMESLTYTGRGLSRDQAEKLQSSERAFVMNIAYPKEQLWAGLRTASELVEELAKQTGGVIWDEETREVFTPDEWHKKRIESWSEVVPDISNHTTIHVYSTGEYVRAITLGMSKVGLPDVIIDNFSWSSNRNIGNLINLFSQAMVEGATLDKSGEFDLDLRAIKNSAVRDPQIESLKENATAIAHLTLLQGTWEEGDPRNRLIEITFDKYSGRDVHAKQVEMISSLFGWDDGVTYIDHNAQLLAVSASAKAKLPALQKSFTAGLEPGEFIQVKAPFATPDGGREWMWVEITAWKGSAIKGLLKNEPFNIPTLHGGQIVEVNEGDIFDYIRTFPDGTQVGNETASIIMKMQEAGK
jgi:uncharacterized protein YegJ (DUF2314 family)